jgi:hypothetical protein
VLTNRYSFLTTDLADLVRKCITKAGIVDKIYNSKCRSVLRSHILFSSYREVRECSIVRVYSLYTMHFSSVRQNDGHHRSRANLRKGNRVLFCNTQAQIKINNASV